MYFVQRCGGERSGERTEVWVGAGERKSWNNKAIEFEISSPSGDEGRDRWELGFGEIEGSTRVVMMRVDCRGDG